MYPNDSMKQGRVKSDKANTIGNDRIKG
jgi:hypothetical protein